MRNAPARVHGAFPTFITALCSRSGADASLRLVVSGLKHTGQFARPETIAVIDIVANCTTPSGVAHAVT